MFYLISRIKDFTKFTAKNAVPESFLVKLQAGTL